jgi:hypothetical protein
MVRSLLVTGSLAVALVASPALAWHEVGHMLTTLIAYKQLSPGDAPSAAVKRLVAVLKRHPRYEQDFARSMPSGLDEGGQARWLLCRASVWPDMVRSDRENGPSYPPQADKQGSYSRGVWHYIDTPLLIVAEGTSDDKIQALEEKARAAQPLSTDVPADEKDVMNVLQAIAFNRRRFSHGAPDEQAVALCWFEIRKQVLAADQDPKSADAGVTVQLPDGYKDRAHDLGKLRVVQGGYRTAEFLKALQD